MGSFLTLSHLTTSAFLPKGNGGDSCTILSLRKNPTNTKLLYYAALFNTLHGWRFSFGRKTSKRRLERLDLFPLYKDAPINIVEETKNNNELMSKLLGEKEIEFGGLQE